jgi:hypothetical protein
MGNGGDREVSTRIGSSFDDFLKEDGIYEETHSIAIKRVLAWQIAQAMKEQLTTGNDSTGRSGWPPSGD